MLKTSNYKFYTPREQVAANPKPFTSFEATFAREHADFTAAQIACHISVEDCWFGKRKVVKQSYIAHI